MNINLLAPINQLGYGIAGFNICRELAEEGNEVSLFPIGPMDPLLQQCPSIDRCIATSNFYDAEAVSLRIWHQDRLAERVGLGKAVGFSFFELDRLLPCEAHHINRLDSFIVSSLWGKQVAIDSGVDIPVHVVPLGVDRHIFHENIEYDRLMPDHTVFLNVGKWEIRKGHDVLIDAFNAAFEPTDKVILRMVALNPFIGEANNQWYRRYKDTKMGERVLVEPARLASQQDLAGIIAVADCGVFPARGEAWNLDLMECMSCGLQCIATNYSGHTQYVNESNCRLIELDGLEPAFDGVWFHGQGEWMAFGQSQRDQLVEHMRDVHRKKQLGELTVNSEGIKTGKHFNWRNTVTRILETIENHGC